MRERERKNWITVKRVLYVQAQWSNLQLLILVLVIFVGFQSSEILGQVATGGGSVHGLLPAAMWERAEGLASGHLAELSCALSRALVAAAPVLWSAQQWRSEHQCTEKD